MKKRIRPIVLALLGIPAALALLLLGCFVHHRARLERESTLVQPLGLLVDVDGHEMSIYVEGAGEKTLVFLSGGGTCSPILDFKSLYSLLSDEYRVVVVEKFGYGFSDAPDLPRDVDTILEESRLALSGAGVDGPYVLIPHSMSGIQSLRWAQKYPEEVSAIIGLDMAVPAAYEDMDISMSLLKLSRFAVDLGITRLIPGLADSDAVRYGTLTEHEKDVYRALFYQGTATVPMLREAAAIKESAAMVAQGGVPQTPMLLFASDGSGGTGFDQETWRGFQTDFAAQVDGAQVVPLDCPHYVHDHEYRAIAEQIKAFLSGT